ncbi:hypothetical protein HYZ78_04080 [Candidatus Microgenomates bacterium]|nr:hypothetical protein [Candidatus Microgenomates bacterium]
MVEIPHVLVGAAIAVKVGNPALALPLAFASHFVLDLLPHTNPSIYARIQAGQAISGITRKIIFTDSLLALIIGSFIAATFLPDLGKSVVILLGAFLAVLPDIVEIPYYFMKSRHPLMVKYVEISRSLQNDVPLLPGTLTQIAVSLAALWWIFA